MTRPSPNQADAELGRERRERICTILAEYSSRERVAPTRDHLAMELGIGTKAVQKHLGILIADRVVEDMGGTRGLRLAL